MFAERDREMGQSAAVQLRQSNVRIGFGSTVDWVMKMPDVC